MLLRFLKRNIITFKVSYCFSLTYYLKVEGDFINITPGEESRISGLNIHVLLHDIDIDSLFAINAEHVSDVPYRVDLGHVLRLICCTDVVERRGRLQSTSRRVRNLEYQV